MLALNHAQTRQSDTSCKYTTDHQMYFDNCTRVFLTVSTPRQRGANDRGPLFEAVEHSCRFEISVVRREIGGNEIANKMAAPASPGGCWLGVISEQYQINKTTFHFIDKMKHTYANNLSC